RGRSTRGQETGHAAESSSHGPPLVTGSTSGPCRCCRSICRPRDEPSPAEPESCAIGYASGSLPAPADTGASERMDIAIVGGGIGGLTLALALHQRGIPCRVYESAPEVKELGVGITLLPHAMREMAALGLAEALT